MKRFFPFLFVCLLLFSCASNETRVNQALSRGMALVDEKRYDEAIQLFDQALEKDQGNMKLLYDKALALFASGRFTEARALCDEAFALHPGSLRFLTLKADSYRAEGNVQATLEGYHRILFLNPGDTDFRVSVMQWALDEGLTEEAKTQAQWLLDHRVNLIEAYTVLGKLSGEGSVEEAIASYLKAHPPVTKAT